VDSYCYSGYYVPPYYDSLSAKLITYRADRNEAIETMRVALSSFVVSGVDTTIPFHQALIDNPDFQDGKVNIHWLEDLLPFNEVIRERDSVC